MPRPFRNPSSDQEVGENYRYLVDLCERYGADVIRRTEADPNWNINAGYQLDRGVFYNDAPYVEVVWPEELRRRERARRPEMDANTGMMRLPALKLEKVEEGPYIPRDIQLSPFKVDYDTHEQINQKLNNTVIFIKNRPFLVLQTAEQKGKFYLYVRGGGDGRNEGVIAYDEVKDCRGVAPGYWMHRGVAMWIYRSPERQNSQGMCGRNTYYRIAGGSGVQPANANMLLDALQIAKDIPYAPNLSDIITGGGNTSIRLSHRIALFLANKKGAPLGVEYCGRPMGLIVNHACKVHDPFDLSPSWIKKDFDHVGLSLTE